MNIIPNRVRPSRRKTAGYSSKDARCLRFQRLEDRHLMAADQLVNEVSIDHLGRGIALPTFVVTNTNDSGEGSLRSAIESANDREGKDTIIFRLENDGTNTFEDVDAHLIGGDEEGDVFVFRPLTPLPSLSDVTGGTWVNATSVTSDTNPFGPEIILDGSLITIDNAPGLELFAGTSGNAIEGVNIQNFSGQGIRIVNSSENSIVGNYIGTDATGTEARGNGFTENSLAGGIGLLSGANDNVIEKNVISGNHRHGIRLQADDSNSEIAGNIIRENRIGTDAFGRLIAGLENRAVGVQLVKTIDTYSIVNNQIIDNVIDGNPSDIEFLGTDESENPISGNSDSLLSAHLSDGILTVTGSTAADHVEILINEDQQIIVYEVVLQTELLVAGANAIEKIVVKTGEGDDWLEINETILLPTELDGGQGNDRIIGGRGRDRIVGGDGNDELLGRDGDDNLIGGFGNDLLVGGEGDDRLEGGGSEDRLVGGSGNDNLYGGPGDDTLYGEKGNDRLYGGDGDDWIDGGEGGDRIYGGMNSDVLLGGKHQDFIRGNSGDDQISGGAGNDEIYGDGGDDRIDGGRGRDELHGGADNDVLAGGVHNDVIDGGNGNDVLNGGDGNDELDGGGNDDILVGGNGEDQFTRSSGQDVKFDNEVPGPELGSITQAISFGDIGDFFDSVGDFIVAAGEWIWDVGGEALEWTTDKLSQFLIQFDHYVFSLDNRIARLGENLWKAAKGSFNHWIWEREFWDGWGKVLVNVLELGGISEIYQLAFEILHPWQRGMRGDEISAATKVFGHSIDYFRVRVSDTTFFSSLLNTSYVTGHTININFRAYHSIDRNIAGTGLDLFIHELMHVWQYEEDGLVYAPEALGDQFLDEGYDYPAGVPFHSVSATAYATRVAELESRLKNDQGLLSFNREQQAMIMQHYYILRESIANPPNTIQAGTVHGLPESTKRDYLGVFAKFVSEASTLSMDVLSGKAGPLAATPTPSTSSSENATIRFTGDDVIFQNPQNFLDVNASGDVTPLDALLIVNRLNRSGERGDIPVGLLDQSSYYYDVNGSLNVSPSDAFEVINFLSRRDARAGQGEQVFAESSQFIVPDLSDSRHHAEPDATQVRPDDIVRDTASGRRTQSDFDLRSTRIAAVEWPSVDSDTEESNVRIESVDAVMSLVAE